MFSSKITFAETNKAAISNFLHKKTRLSSKKAEIKKGTNPSSIDEAKKRYLKWKENKEQYLNHKRNLKHAQMRYQAYQSAKQKKLIKKSKEHFLQLQKRKGLMEGKENGNYIIKKFTVEATKDGKVKMVPAAPKDLK